MTQSNNIILDHGSGGKMSHELIKNLILPHFSNKILETLDDSAVLSAHPGRIAFTTDSYVIDPVFFPGGDIGRLSICGTVNDLAMSGAVPYYLSAGFIIEEGFPIKDIETIITSMENTAKEAGILLVTGDTKVVHKGSADKIFISTSGIGFLPDGIDIRSSNAQAGDVIIVSGTLGDHGVSVLAKREGLDIQTSLESDAAPLNKIVQKLIKNKIEIHSLKDPTRGGLASALFEIAEKSSVCLAINENDIPIRADVKSVCDILGLDPLFIANEGKFVACIRAEVADHAIALLQTTEYGKNAQIIGKVLDQPKKKVILKTTIGTERSLEMLTGDQLPRIC